MRRYNRISFGDIIISTLIAAILIGILFLAFVGLTDASGAIATLQGAGYTDIKITGNRPFMRGQGDFYSTGFEASGPTGRRVSGAVTAGLFKGSTIRFD
jgi:hypothetical protein